MFGVNVGTIVGWEIERWEPKVSYIPAIIGFIGYDPFSGATILGERLRAERWKLGLTQHQLARKLGTLRPSAHF